MPCHPSVKICTHIKVTGHSCGSPALRGKRFCYFHERMIHGVPTPPKSRIHPMALIESAEGIQVALMETLNAIARNTIDLKRATLILRALSIATRNSRHARFDRHESEMVQAIPDYEPALAIPENSEAAEIPSGKSLPPAPPKGTTQAATPRKPPARAASAPIAQAKAANAGPQRE